MLDYVMYQCSQQRISMPEVIYESIVEVEERVVLSQDNCQLNLKCDTVQGVTGEEVQSVSMTTL